MSNQTILVIDDSATIRKLVDTHLSPVGYRVVLAPNAEDGIQLAGEIEPDLILLDHQLPGTTGYDVCCKLVESPALSGIPVVISSTLRKKAYAEYIDLDNVVDMLPKPYTEELLRTTVANALETAAMIVASQSQGTAVPEVIQQLDEAALSGSLACFGLRELIDFLNNGRKVGVLEVEAEQTRIRFHLDRGRVQAVSATGIADSEIDQMIQRLPKSLANLAPVLKMTISGRSCAEVDGFVQLLDQKVLDPRLMTKLMSFQAAMLVRLAFSSELKQFRFEAGHVENALHKNLPLDISLLALLVEGAIYADEQSAHQVNHIFVRRAIRGQNLDRAGLNARHMKILNVLTEPKDLDQVATALNWESDEVRQVLEGFVLAELVEQREQAVAGQFIVFEPDGHAAQSLRRSIEDSPQRYSGKVVRDKLALQLVLKRSIPHTLIFAGDDEATCELIQGLFATSNPKANHVKRIAIHHDPGNPSIDWRQKTGFEPHDVVSRPCTAELLYRAMDRLFEAPDQEDPSSASINATASHAVPLDSLQNMVVGAKS